AQPAWHHVLVQVRGDARTGHLTLVDTKIEACGGVDGARHAHGVLSHARELGRLGLVEVRVVRDVAVREHHEVPRVVRVEVEHHVAALTAGDDEPLLVVALRDAAERALPRAGVGGLVLPADVDHAVRRPQPLVPVVRRAEVRAVLGDRLHQACCARSATAVTMRSTASATGTPFSCVPSRNRNDTAPASASSPPAMSVKGTFSLDALRIFLANRSSDRSTSTRTPRAVSCAATSLT